MCGAWGHSAWECVYVINVCVSLPNEAAALSPGPEMSDGEDVPEWPRGLREDSQKALAIPQQPRELCALAGSWACSHSSCHVGLAYVTGPRIPHSKRLNPSLPRREARPALGLAPSLALSPPWPLRLPAPAEGTDPADRAGRHTACCQGEGRGAQEATNRAGWGDRERATEGSPDLPLVPGCVIGHATPPL